MGAAATGALVAVAGTGADMRPEKKPTAKTTTTTTGMSGNFMRAGYTTRARRGTVTSLRWRDAVSLKERALLDTLLATG